MKFYLPEFDCSAFPKIYAGTESRYATATAVTFVSGSDLVVAHFLSKMLHFVSLAGESCQFKQEVKSEFYHDLMDYKNNVLITSNFPSLEQKHGSLSIYDVGDSIKPRKSIIFKGSDTIKVHGCRLINNNRAIVTSVGDYMRGLIFVDLESEKIDLFDDFLYYPKDVLIEDGVLFIITSASRPNSVPVDILDSYIYAYDLESMTRIAEHKFYGQTDAIAKVQDDIFVTLQGQHCLAHLKYTDSTLNGPEFNEEALIKGFSFPHGIASFDDMICVTNYGDNSFELYQSVNDLYMAKAGI